jgi:transcriptional regulator with XRE-family HTH domain
MQKFSSWLLEELTQRDMSQSDLARACNITTAQTSRIISGERNVGTKSLTNIAQALKLPVDFVFEKAGLLPRKSNLSPIQRTITYLMEGLPDSDLELTVAILTQRHNYYRRISLENEGQL